MDPQPEPVSYICGDCGQENTLKPGDVIQCRECGYRILYKKRTRRTVIVMDNWFQNWVYIIILHFISLSNMKHVETARLEGPVHIDIVNDKHSYCSTTARCFLIFHMLM
ncbi:DNA-directed RNA polymerases II, IV and V subunit 12 [Olea europaea subsp. europaea]|uniref:DNA-directed RNA polymerases II, IV and V subunit 12 n=1 Tax=Olea europaea subsp. europaea TaxID=158383 RepID=A0A8S0TUZ1_OLEEU|nr:DNA-directed RNA polymerases II, IV and V subunit 12 [Olea europaea subsp. europaea]